MPALTMRGRYLMREYWEDTDLFTRLTADVRELYQGLWMLCDDFGWMPRDVTGIGAALYRFEEKEARAVLVRDGIARLGRLGKLKSYRCGCLFLPAVAKYPRAGNKSDAHRQNHLTHSNMFNDVQTGSNPIGEGLNPSPVPTRPVPSLPDVARATDDFKSKMAANGLKGETR